jgi:pimeloyl-ACP methyl ester carboxylesterase
LAVFLHGVGSSSTWVPGGGGGLADMTGSLIENASTSGFLLISINTRSSEGFYANTPCGGPQEQDVLDAITHESGLRHVTSVYLIGFSMGSLGAFSIAGHHPGLIAGVATAGSITDIYETTAYNMVSHSDSPGLYDDECGAHPGPLAGNASVNRLWSYLSVARLVPQNFSGISLFVSGGGQDTRAPNNFARWAYANVNNTFVNATCLVASQLGEPASCTVPFATLAAQGAGSYHWLDLYEPDAPHSPQQLPGGAVFSFFEGHTTGGYYVSTFPGAQMIPYTPGNPIDLPHNSPPFGPLVLWTGIAIGVVVVAVVVLAVAFSRNRRR